MVLGTEGQARVAVREGSLRGGVGMGTQMDMGMRILGTCAPCKGHGEGGGYEVGARLECVRKSKEA